MTADAGALQALSQYSGPLSGAPRPTVADVVVATLKASGVRRIYGLPGDSLNGLTDALRRDGEVSWQHVRHEESAAFAASAEAATTGGPAVCAASCGPGNLHLVNGLFDAQRSRVPVLALAAHIPIAEVGSGYFQRRTRRSSSESAASTPSWSAFRSSCRACCTSPCARRSNAAGWPSW